jgi:two-component system probable response regulator PhcQ
MRRILLVDDEISILHALQRSLRKIARDNDLQIELCTSPRAAIQMFSEAEFDFVISDYHMPGMNGVDFLRIIKEIQPDTVRMMLSASADFSTIMGAVNEAEVFRYIVKPWDAVELEEVVTLALQHRARALEEKQLADETRMQRNELTPQEVEARRLEQSEPGITKVKWGPDGSVLLDD